MSTSKSAAGSCESPTGKELEERKEEMRCFVGLNITGNSEAKHSGEVGTATSWNGNVK